MQPRTTTLLTAALTAAALTLTACSGDSGSSDDKIKGADKADKSDSAPADRANRPKITTPGLKMTFENWTDSDPKAQAVLSDGKEGVRAVNEAILENPPNLESKHLAFYNTNSALVTGKEWIKGFKDNNLTITGAIRYFDPEVKFREKDGAASLTYCSDESKGASKDRKTGKVDTSGAGGSFIEYQSLLRKNEDGVWRTEAVVSNRENCS